MTTKVLVLYYSTYGHVEALAGAVSQGGTRRRRGEDGAEAGSRDHRPRSRPARSSDHALADAKEDHARAQLPKLFI
jgi:hypothetical protein